MDLTLFETDSRGIITFCHYLTLNNLVYLCGRYRQLGGAGGLDGVIGLDLGALSLCPPRHPDGQRL